MDIKLKKDEIDCELMEGIKTEVTPNFQNAWIMFLLYNSMVYVWEHKEDFARETKGAFCIRCWKQFEILMDELGTMVEHARLHTLN
jgi:hypothetical protein